MIPGCAVLYVCVCVCSRQTRAPKGGQVALHLIKALAGHRQAGGEVVDGDHQHVLTRDGTWGKGGARAARALEEEDSGVVTMLYQLVRGEGGQ